VAADSVARVLDGFPRLDRACELIEEQGGRAEFWSSPRGQRFPGYLAKVSRGIDAGLGNAHEELAALQAHIDHVRQVVAMQQEYARGVLQIETFAVAEIVEEAVRYEEPLLRRDGVTLRMRLDRELVLSTDRHKLLQILINLIRNAREFAREGPAEDHSVEVEASRTQEKLRISVRDNGSGIAPEVMPKLFRHGFTTRPGGHGFGLHMSSLDLKVLGGRIWAESDGPGCGACFVVELSLGTPEEK